MRLILLLLAPAVLAAQWGELVVVEKVANRVSFYSPDGKRLAETVVGETPHEMVFDPDRRHLYVSDNGVLWMTYTGPGGNTISVVDTQTRKRVRVIDLGEYHRPHGLAIIPASGHLLSTIENPDGLVRIDPMAGKVLRMYDVQGEDPHMVAVEPSGCCAWVSNTATHEIAVVDLETGAVTKIPLADGPQQTIFSHDGKTAYTVSGPGATLSVIDVAQRQIQHTIATGPGPGRVALTPDGEWLVFNNGEGGDAVQFARPDAAKPARTVKLGGRPLSLTLSGDGKWAFAGIQDQDRIVVLSVAEQRIVDEIHLPKGSGPDPAIEVGR